MSVLGRWKVAYRANSWGHPHRSDHAVGHGQVGVLLPRLDEGGSAVPCEAVACTRSGPSGSGSGWCGQAAQSSAQPGLHAWGGWWRLASSPILIDPSFKSYRACRGADGLLHVVDLDSEMAPKGVLVVAALACQVATAFVPVVPVSSVPACTRVSTAPPLPCP